MEKKPSVCIVTTPLPENLIIVIRTISGIMLPLCRRVSLITGDFPHEYDDRMHIKRILAGSKAKGLAGRAVRALLYQLKATISLIRWSQNFEIVYVLAAECFSFLPIMTAKLMRKRVGIIHLGGSKVIETQKSAGSTWQKAITAFAWRFFIATMYRLADQILCESPSIIRFGGLTRYEGKIAIRGALSIDGDVFRVKRKLAERKKIIGFAGRLAPVNGVTNFIEAIPLVLKKDSSYGFLIIGDGHLLPELKERIRKGGLEDKVLFTGWIPHHELSDYLNRLRLLVLPTYTAGIPVIIQEAMACGTPVLATPVGGVPDLIKDGETGFVIQENSPESITRNALQALVHPDLEKISQNAQALIAAEYNYTKAVERYRNILARLAT